MFLNKFYGILLLCLLNLNADQSCDNLDNVSNNSNDSNIDFFESEDTLRNMELNQEIQARSVMYRKFFNNALIIIQNNEYSVRKNLIIVNFENQYSASSNLNFIYFNLTFKQMQNNFNLIQLESSVRSNAYSDYLIDCKNASLKISFVEFLTFFENIKPEMQNDLIKTLKKDSFNQYVALQKSLSLQNYQAKQIVDLIKQNQHQSSQISQLLQKSDKDSVTIETLNSHAKSINFVLQNSMEDIKKLEKQCLWLHKSSNSYYRVKDDDIWSNNKTPKNIQDIEEKIKSTSRENYIDNQEIAENEKEITQLNQEISRKQSMIRNYETTYKQRNCYANHYYINQEVTNKENIAKLNVELNQLKIKLEKSENDMKNLKNNYKAKLKKDLEDAKSKHELSEIQRLTRLSNSNSEESAYYKMQAKRLIKIRNTNSQKIFIETSIHQTQNKSEEYILRYLNFINDLKNTQININNINKRIKSTVLEEKNNRQTINESQINAFKNLQLQLKEKLQSIKEKEKQLAKDKENERKKKLEKSIEKLIQSEKKKRNKTQNNYDKEFQNISDKFIEYNQKASLGRGSGNRGRKIVYTGRGRGQNKNHC